MAPFAYHKPAVANMKQAKLLIVEDNPDQQTIMRTMLSRSLPNVSLVCVDTADEARQLLTDWCTQEWELPKLILQDLYLPEREAGLDLLRQIKALPMSGRQIPVLMFSSSNQPADIGQSYRNGASSYLIKPIDTGSWHAFLSELCVYWWETVTLPPLYFTI